MASKFTSDELIAQCCSIDQPESVDLAIVLGCTEPGNDPDFALRNRVRRCIELAHGGYFRRILLTGAAPRDAVDPTRASEAARMLELLHRKIPAGIEIILEPQARNTHENATQSAVLLTSIDPDFRAAMMSVMIITCDYHTRRARMEFQKAFPGVRILCCAFENELPYRIEKCNREIKRLNRL